MASVRRSERVRDLLENAIINGEYEPGTKLDFQELQEKYTCSRTPIREALQLLDKSGMVRIAPKQGTFVTQFAIGELAERFEVMAELEGMSARLAARRMNESEINELQESHKICSDHVKAVSFDGYYNENSIFHSKIYDGSKNTFLAHEAKQMHAVLHPYRRMQLRARNRMKESLSEHETIIEAIRDGDPQTAEQAMKSHVKIQGDSFNDFLAALNKA